MNKKKFIAMALMTAMIMSFFTFAAPFVASASNEGELATKVFNFDPGNSWAATGQLTAVADPANHTVTVTGTVTGATNELVLDIDAGVTVIWKAEYSGSTSGMPSGLIQLNGDGSFEVAEGGSLVNNGAGCAIYALTGSGKISVIVSGGTVRATAGYAIGIGRDNTKVTVSGGEVSATKENAIIIEGDGVAVNVSGGTISTGGTGVAILIKGNNEKIEMNGGVVRAAFGNAIAIGGDNAKIEMNGGEISTTIWAGILIIGDNAEIKMNGGEISTTTGMGIRIEGANGRIEMSGGSVKVNSALGIGICIDGVNGKIIVSDGTVIAENMAALYIDGANAEVTVSGGFVFAYGTAIAGSGNVINMVSGGTPQIEGTAVVCAWNRDAGNSEYVSETTSDMNVSPAGAASWGLNGIYSGINYSNGANTGFFPVSLVTITPSEYTITFESDEGSAVAEQKVISGNKVAEPADPEKEGFAFAGWFADEALSSGYDFSDAVTADLVLYAKWEEIIAEPPIATGSMANFQKSKIYVSKQFTDVDETQWYGYNDTKAIANAFEYGLMVGDSETIFRPTGNISIAEAITMAVRVHSIYMTGQSFAPVPATNPWYQGYVEYAIGNGIINAGDFSDYETEATRAQMAYIFTRALPDFEFAEQNTVYGLPDVNAATPYYNAIMKFYKSGILAGNDTKGTFYPQNKITRYEVAAIISRVIIPATRFNGKTYSDTVYIISEYYSQSGEFSSLGAVLAEQGGEKVQNVKKDDIIVVNGQKYIVIAATYTIPFYTQSSLAEVNQWWADYITDAEIRGIVQKVN